MQERKFLSTIKWKDGYIMFNIVLERLTSDHHRLTVNREDDFVV